MVYATGADDCARAAAATATTAAQRVRRTVRRIIPKKEFIWSPPIRASALAVFHKSHRSRHWKELPPRLRCASPGQRFAQWCPHPAKDAPCSHFVRSRRPALATPAVRFRERLRNGRLRPRSLHRPAPGCAPSRSAIRAVARCWSEAPESPINVLLGSELAELSRFR